MSDSRRTSSECLAPAASADSSAGADTVRDAQTIVRFRLLPDGDFQEAPQLGWKGRVLRIDLQGQDLAIGAPIEIESGFMLYLGELCQRDGSVGSVLVEHSLDRAELATDRDHWG
jgi:hypothetical protein